MTATGAQTRTHATDRNRPGILTRICRRGVLRQLSRLRHGRITLRDGAEVHRFGEITGDCPLAATVTVHDPAFYRDLALGGSLGASEAFIAGHWSCDDLFTLMRIMVRNGEDLSGLDSGLARLRAPLRKIAHLLNRNSRRGSRRNISAHYDLSNDFFRLFLDETMTYSCAVFEREDATLAEASTAKLDRICRRLDLKPQDHVLEIGTGWGSFAIHAAREYGCRVTTATISREQHALATERVREAGLKDRVNVLLSDYRDLEGEFDKVVSIEMIEAVGHEYLDTYFSAISDRLRPDGMALIQAITIRDQEYDRYRRSVDFIRTHIFPGSCITSVSAVMASVRRATDMVLGDLEDITPHYVKTLLAWRERFQANADQVRALGFPEPFLRMWDHYLCYCAGGFAERWIGTVQMLFTKPRCRWSAVQPAPREQKCSAP
ncbi:class I SAM-dependent methyltransferase [Candidatus Sumerlaeota bacterium]|nr:class I SAM-dependent methyltransferase [Candidatus Sumerlaeota bacterium]